MANDGYRTIRLSEELVQAIEKFLEKPEAKKLHVTSVASFVSRAAQTVLSDYEKEFGVFVPRRLKGKYRMQPFEDQP